MENLKTFKKRLLYQSQHRGMREMDLILGKFAEIHLANMNEEDCQNFEALLAFPDQELYGWFFENDPIPQEIPLRIIKMICQYIKTL